LVVFSGFFCASVAGWFSLQCFGGFFYYWWNLLCCLVFSAFLEVIREGCHYRGWSSHLQNWIIVLV
jgi:hypothetical protein